MAQSMSTKHEDDSPAGRVMDEAIELDLAGCSPYPKRATFLDADEPYVGREIRRAVEEDMAIVLVEADGRTLTLRESPGRARVRRSIRRLLRARGSARTARRGL
jgi:hypothetical protein